MRGRTGGLPKTLVPVLGEPFAHHQLRLLASQGVREVVLVIGHGGSEIRESIGDEARQLIAIRLDAKTSVHQRGS